jgi:hypothetical protein
MKLDEISIWLWKVLETVRKKGERNCGIQLSIRERFTPSTHTQATKIHPAPVIHLIFLEFQLWVTLCFQIMHGPLRITATSEGLPRLRSECV